MSELFNFKRFDPFTIGFTDVFDELEKVTKQVQKAASYPPYNIKRIDDTKYVIEMAVAGFAKQDIEVLLDGNKLVITGNAQESDKDYDNILYRGIANRNFSREFTLADKVEIENAELVNGMLKIGLAHLVKAQDAIKKIAVK